MEGTFLCSSGSVAATSAPASTTSSTTAAATAKGRAGIALSTAAIGSFIAGTIATLLIALFAPILGEVALKFGPAEYFSLLSLGLVAALVLAHGSLLQAFGTVIVGLLLGLIGPDVNSGVMRFTFGVTALQDGISFVIVAMGVFGLGEIVANLGDESGRSITNDGINKMLPGREDIKRMAAPILRGTALGSILGILPGGGAMLASFASYSVEKKLSRRPDEFGKGAIEGVAGPEAANNAGAQTAFIPMLTLGVPSNSIMALIIGAMIIQGIQPGPSVMVEQPALFWGVIVSMWIGNLMLLVLNLPMIGLWVRMIGIPYHFLFPAILVFCAIGAFSLSNSTFDVFLLAAFGVIGHGYRERAALSEAIVELAGAVSLTEELLVGLEVDTSRMANNLQMTNGQIHAEAIMIYLSDRMGRIEAHQVLHQVSHEASRKPDRAGRP